MATGNIRGGKRNYARPTTPTTASVANAATGGQVDVTFTGSTLGPAATSYVLTATSTSTGAVTITSTLTTSPTTVTAFIADATYAFTLSGQNYNGLGTPISIGNLVIPASYVLQSTYNTSGSYTVASGVSKIAAFLISGAGGGARGANTNTNSHTGGAGGGGGGPAIVGFKEFSVTAGQTVTITVGAAGNGSTNVTSGNAGGQSIITYGGVDIATANGGGGGSNGNIGSSNSGQGTGGAGGAGGTGSSNVAGAITVTGPTGGAGAGGNSAAGAESGANQTSNSTIVVEGAITNLLPSNTSYGSGGGGGLFGNIGRNTGAAGAGAGAGGNDANNAAGSGNSFGGGGGGGAGVGQSGGAGGNGYAGRVILYTK